MVQEGCLLLSSRKLSSETSKSLWSKALQDAFIRAKASKWRKVASEMAKCKSIVEQLQCHLVIQKNRRQAIIRQERSDIGQLLQIGQLEQAGARIEKLYKSQCLLDAYDQIDSFCNCITANVADIYRHKDSTLQNLPSDVGEAMASLIYAASRCGELPELHRIRCLFKEINGSEFEITSVELGSGNLVNPQLKEKLDITRIPDEVKQELIGDIVTKCNIHLALHDIHDTIHQKAAGNPLQVPISEMVKKPVGIFCSLSEGKLPQNCQMEAPLASAMSTPSFQNMMMWWPNLAVSRQNIIGVRPSHVSDTFQEGVVMGYPGGVGRIMPAWYF